MTAVAASLPSAGPSSRGYHRLADYMVCPQRYAFRNLLHLEPARASDPLALGSLVHIGLMHHYLGRVGSPHALDPVDAMRTAPARIAHQFARAVELLAAYRRRYAAEPIRVLDVEREFQVRAGGFLYTQRADLVVELGGRVVVLDHKCESKINDDAMRRHESEGQFIGYEVLGRRLLAELYGLPWGGVYVNAIRTQPPLDAADSFRRVPLRISSEKVARFPAMVMETNAAIEADESAHRDPRRYRQNYEACVGMRFVCPYKVVCDRGRGAEADFVIAVDAATAVREGSGT